MIDAYAAFWKKTFDFKGRSTRSQYWWAYLANTLVGILLFFLAYIKGEFEYYEGGIIFNILVLYFYASILPWLSISIRRVRDAGKNWPWIFISLVPFIGSIWFIVILCQPSLPMA